MGADAYLTKPFDPSEMIRVVREWPVPLRFLPEPALDDHRRAAARDRRRGRPADAEPLLRPGPAPGSYMPSLPFRLDPGDPGGTAAQLAARLSDELWIATAEVTGPGFLTVTVTHATLTRLAIRIANAGPACAQSDALAGRTVPRPGRPP